MGIKVIIRVEDSIKVKRAWAIDDTGKTICWNVFPQNTKDKEVKKVLKRQAKNWLKDRKENYGDF